MYDYPGTSTTTLVTGGREVLLKIFDMDCQKTVMLYGGLEVA